MTEAKHTPTPWRVEYKYGQTHIIMGDGDSHMCDETYYPWVPENDADWHRIVACVNACEGIPTSALEGGVIGELVKALEAGLQMLSVAVETAGGDPKTHYGCSDMRAALHKARGEAT